MNDIKIANRTIASDRPPLIIAEMSGNHNQSLEQALKIVDAAAEAGCDGLKIQTYTADSITIDCKSREFLIDDQDSLWKGRYLYELYQEAQTPKEWQEPILKRCRERGLIGFSTPFDESAVDFLEELNVPAYKIASFENTHLPLIKKCAATGKPLLISTGMASVVEIKEAVSVAKDAGCRDLILLKCTSAYPALAEDANILTIPDMIKQFGCHVGLSDHTTGIGVAVAGVALGVRVVEKHFTLSRADGGVDAAFSLEPDEMRQLVEETKRAYAALGQPQYGPGKNEEKNLRFRQSIFVVKDIKAGDSFTAENVRVIRPGYGLEPKNYDKIIGKKAKTDISRGVPLDWEKVS